MVGGANAQDPQGWKRPWGLWGMGLRLKDQKGPRRAPTPGLRGQGTSPGSLTAFLASSGRGKHPPLLLLSPASPDLPGLRGADPVWPPLLLPSQSPHILPVRFGVPPISLGVRVPHQRTAGTLVVGRH